MIDKTKNIFFLLLLFIFLFLVTKYYFSEKNFIFTNKLRLSFAMTLHQNIENLPVLNNDTQNIITYKNDLEEFKKKRKKRFWERLISNNNE